MGPGQQLAQSDWFGARWLGGCLAGRVGQALARSGAVGHAVSGALRVDVLDAERLNALGAMGSGNGRIWTAHSNRAAMAL